jgi:hypothetical protein
MKRRERVKEYFPLQRAHDTDEDDMPGAQCRVCKYEGAYASHGTGPTFSNGKWSYGGSPGSGLAGPIGNEPFGVSNPWGYGSSYGNGSWSSTSTSSPVTDPATTSTSTSSGTTGQMATPTNIDLPPAVPLDPLQPSTPAVGADPTPKPAVAKTPVLTGGTPDPAPGVVTNTPSGPTPIMAAPPEGASIAMPSPWKSSLALCTIAFGFILFTRAVRRALTLRHLAHPFWNESFDQRISNHWERMLVGLRDAGLEPSEDEQPLAFAKRIGIEGMEACATILERVRHGVRVDSEDLTNMRASAESVFRTARQRAGFIGRATAWLRPPMA